MSDVAPLDADEDRLWRNLMRLVITVPRTMSDDLERAGGLNGSEYSILMHLSETRGQELRMSDLAELTALSPSRITRIVDDLAGRKMVDKRRCPNDGRSMLASLTKAGLASLEQAYPDHLASVRRMIFDNLTPSESTRVGRVLQKLATALDDLSAPRRRRRVGA